MKISRWIFGFSVLMGAVLLCSEVRANGRYAQASLLAEDPSDSNRLWLRTSYGVLTTPNRGANWYWTCEEGIGFRPGDRFDPMFGVHADGTVIAALTAGLKTSFDKGCSWPFASSVTRDKFVLDLAVDKQEKSHALALISYLDNEAIEYVNEIWETTDNSRSFNQISDNLPGNIFFNTIDAAPSEPSRVYVSGGLVLGADAGFAILPVVMRSDDRGKTWHDAGWSGLSEPLASNTEVYIAAVDSANADKLYVRTRSVDRIDSSVTSALLYSADGGATWRELFREEAPMLGFALSPDNSTVAIGFGDPGDEAYTGYRPADEVLGLWRSSTSNFNFQKVFDKTVGCLTWTEKGLYACSYWQTAGFDLGISRDGGQTFLPLLNKRWMSGPLVCDPGSTIATECTADKFATLCASALGCEDGGLPGDQEPSDGGDAEAGPNVDDGGPADASLESGPPDGAHEQSSGGDADCGCRMAGDTGRDALALLGFLLAGGCLCRRRHSDQH